MLIVHEPRQREAGEKSCGGVSAEESWEDLKLGFFSLSFSILHQSSPSQFLERLEIRFTSEIMPATSATKTLTQTIPYFQ
jgi:hypothetical protein